MIIFGLNPVCLFGRLKGWFCGNNQWIMLEKKKSVDKKVQWTPECCQFFSPEKSDNTSLFPLAPALFTYHRLKKHINQIVICSEPSEVQLQRRWQVLMATQTTCLIVRLKKRKRSKLVSSTRPACKLTGQLWVFFFFWCTCECADVRGVPAAGQSVSTLPHPVVEPRSSFTRHVNLSSQIHSLIHHFHIPQSALHPSIRPAICHFVVCVYIYLLLTDFTSACLFVYFAIQPAHRQGCFLAC